MRVSCEGLCSSNTLWTLTFIVFFCSQISNSSDYEEIGESFTSTNNSRDLKDYEGYKCYIK